LPTHSNSTSLLRYRHRSFWSCSRAMSRDKDDVVILTWKHVPGVEAHPERGCMWSEQRDRLGELRGAIVTPAELLIGEVSLMAVGKAEIVLAGTGDAVELFLR